MHALFFSSGLEKQEQELKHPNSRHNADLIAFVTVLLIHEYIHGPAV
jgi:hypothetical protein